MLRLQSAALVFAGAASALPQADIPCALNGHLSTAGVCICRRAWKGQNCSELVLQPATVAFKLEDMVAWGVAVQQDTDGSWHAFVAAYEGGLGNWDPNSHIVHAIAGKGVGPEGPYELAGESADTSTVVGKYHASPGILKVGGLYYLFTTGTSWNSTGAVPHGPQYNQLVVSVSRSLHGPWNTTAHKNAFGGAGRVLNVGVIQLPDGSFALSGDTHSSNGGVFVGSTPVGPFAPASPTCHGLPRTCGSCSKGGTWVFDANSDPGHNYREGHRIYQDRGGYFHVLCHALSLQGDSLKCPSPACDSGSNCTESAEGADMTRGIQARTDPPKTGFPPHCGGHKYAKSLAGPWYDSPVGPYTTTVEWASGETTVGYRRERPFALLDPVTGDPSYLFNGIDFGNGTHPFVMVQKVGP